MATPGERYTTMLVDYKGHVHMIRDLGIDTVIKKIYPNLEIALHQDGVRLTGSASEIKNAEKFLAHVIDQPTGKSGWKLDNYRKLLLQLEGTQKFIVEQLKRHKIKCHMPFSNKSTLEKIYALSSDEAAKAEKVVEESIEILKVPVHESFLKSAFEDLSFNYPEKIIQVNEGDEAVLVFTIDVFPALQAARDAAVHDEATGVDEKGGEYVMLKGITTDNSLNNNSKTTNKPRPSVHEQPGNDSDSDKYESQGEDNASSNHPMYENSDEVKVGTGGCRSASPKVRTSSYGEISVEMVDMEINVANYLLKHCKPKIDELMHKYKISIHYNNGLEVSGEICSKEKQTIRMELRLLGKTIIYGCDHFDGLDSLKYFQSEKVLNDLRSLSDNGEEVTVLPWEGGNIQEVDLLRYKGTDIKIMCGSMMGLKSAGMVVCPLNEKLQPSSAMAKQIVSEGGDKLEQMLVTDLNNFLKNTGKNKCDIGRVNFMTMPANARFDWMAGIVLGSDWFTNQPATDVREIKRKIRNRFRHILGEADIVKGQTSVAIPLEVGEKIPATLIARQVCKALKRHYDDGGAKVHLKTMYLCLMDGRLTENIGRVVTKCLPELTAPRGSIVGAGGNITVRTKVQVVVDSLVKQKVDAIVVPVGHVLKLDQGQVSKTVLDAAGKDIQAELSRSYPKGIGPSEVAKSSPGKLSNKLILYACLSRDTGYRNIITMCYKTLMHNCYEVAAKHKLHSLAFPAIGAGGLNLPVTMVTKEMFRAAYLFAGQRGVRMVKFVLFHKDKGMIQAFQHLHAQYQQAVEKIHKVESMSREYIEILVDGFGGKVQILDSDHENGMSDVIIYHGLPKQPLNTDVSGEHNIVIRSKHNEGCLVDHVIFLGNEQSYCSDTLREQYRSVLEHVIVKLNSQIVTVDFTSYAIFDLFAAVMEVLKILSAILSKTDSQPLARRINLIVPPTLMPQLVRHAKQEQDKPTEDVGALKRIGQSMIRAVTPKSGFSWKLISVRGCGKMGSGVSVIVCADSKKVQKRDVEELLEDFRTDIDNYTHEVAPPLPAKNLKSYQGDVPVPRETTEQQQSQPSDNHFEVFGSVTSKISKAITMRYSAVELNGICEVLSDAEGVSAILGEGGIEILFDFSRAKQVEVLLQNVFCDTDSRPYYVHDLAERMYSLLLFHLDEHGQQTDYKSKLHYSSGELKIIDQAMYLVVASKLKTLKTFSTDFVDVSSASLDKIKEAMKAVEKEHPDVMMCRIGSQIEVHGSSEKLAMAKYRLKVLLGQIVTRTRGERMFDDFLSLQSTLNESENSDKRRDSGGLSPIDGRSAFTRSQSLDSSTPSPSAKQSRHFFKNTARGKRTSSGSLSDGSGLTFRSVIGSLKLKVHTGDILQQPVDCIVNAANSELAHGGGVAGIIARAAGPELQRESYEYIKKWGNVEVTKCVCTTAGNLPYKLVLHAVGPRRSDYKDPDLMEEDLQKTVANCLLVAERNRMTSVAIPSISAGIFGVPEKVCAEQYGRGVAEFTENSNGMLEEVHFIDVKQDMVATIQAVFTQMFVVEGSNHQASDLEDSSVSVQPDSGAVNFSVEGSTMSSASATGTVHSGRNVEETQQSTTLVKMDKRELLLDDAFISQEEALMNKGNFDGSFLQHSSKGLSSHRSSASYSSMPADLRRHDGGAKPKTGKGEGRVREKADKQRSFDVVDRTDYERSWSVETEDKVMRVSQMINESGMKKKSDIVESLSCRERLSETEKKVTHVSEMMNESGMKTKTDIFESLSHRETKSEVYPHEEWNNEADRVSSTGKQGQRYRIHIPQCSVNVLIYSADISQVKVDVVISTEDKECTGRGRIAKSIGNACGEMYWRDEHVKMRKQKLKYMEATVTGAGGGAGYKWVIHTVAPRRYRGHEQKLEHFKKEMRKTLHNIFHVVAKKCSLAQSVAIPFLGYIDYELEECCDVFVDAIMDCLADRMNFPHLAEIHLVGYSSEIVESLHSSMENMLAPRQPVTV